MIRRTSPLAILTVGTCALVLYVSPALAFFAQAVGVASSTVEIADAGASFGGAPCGVTATAFGLAPGASPSAVWTGDLNSASCSLALGIPAGEKGATGAQGVAGSRGTTGSQGPQGVQGPQGSVGSPPTVTAESAGANCSAGGSKIVGSGTGYACNGAAGSGGAVSIVARDLAVTYASSGTTAATVEFTTAAACLVATSAGDPGCVKNLAPLSCPAGKTPTGTPALDPEPTTTGGTGTAAWTYSATVATLYALRFNPSSGAFAFIGRTSTSGAGIGTHTLHVYLSCAPS